MTNSNIISAFWLLNCFFLALISFIFKSPGPEFSGGIYYIALTLMMLSLTFVFNEAGHLKEFNLPWPIFILGLFIILFSEPLYENDHFRYLWEGNALWRAENPYLNAPNSSALDHLKFSAREHIGFSDLTTVYPPLALLWFGVGGVFDLTIGLRILMCLNGVLLLLIFKKLKNLTEPWMLVALFPILIKEFLQAIHIDLLAAFFFLLFILEKNNNFRKRVVLLFLSIWIKVLGVVGLPFLLFQKNLTKGFLKKALPVLIVFISLPLFFEWFIGIENLIGVKEFSKGWVWNPGFYSLLVKSGLDEVMARSVSIGCYLFYLLLLGSFCLRELLKRKFVLNEQFCLLMYYFIFSGLMFFTPVYNGWYAIWFLFPALLLKLRTGVLYGVFSVFCYLYYGHPELSWLGEILTHIWFPLSLVELLFGRRAACAPENAEFRTKGVI